MPACKNKRKYYKRGNFQENVAPWYSSEEYNEVVQKLFSENVEDKQWAYDSLLGWKARNSKKFSVAMEVTVMLMNAYIHDLLMSQGKLPWNESCLLALYGLAIIRYVSLISDKTRNELVHKISLKTAAAEFGISEHIVELRHAVTHYDLPSLHYIRQTALDNLNWLRDNFWIPYKQENVVHVMDTKLIVDTLSQYQQVHIQKREKKMAPNFQKNIDNCCKEVKFQLKKYPLEFFNTLAGPHHLLPPSRYVDFIAESRGGIREVDLELLPLASIHIWGQLLEVLEQEDLLQTLVECLLLNLSKHTELADNIALAWVTYLLNTYPGHPWHWGNLLRCAVKSPCKGVGPLLQRLLENQDPPIEEKAKETIKLLVSIYNGKFPEGSSLPQDDSEFHTKEDAEYLLQAKLQKANPSSNPFKWSQMFGHRFELLGDLDHNLPAPEEYIEEPEQLPCEENLRIDYVYDRPRCSNQVHLPLSEFKVEPPSKETIKKFEEMFKDLL